jgi:hypothetical protein
MRSRNVVRFVAVASLVAFGGAACVGDDNGQPNGDAATVDGADATTTNDAAANDVATMDAEVFESGVSCNNVNPSSAPDPAVITCSTTTSMFTGGGGAIVTGSSYLTTEQIYAASCTGLVPTSPYYDVVFITQGDASTDFTLDVGLTEGVSHRYTLNWSIANGMLTQTATCPSSSNAFTGPYSVSSPTAGQTVISWQFTIGAGPNAVTTEYTLHSF